MPIRWSALKVTDACDMVEEFVNQAAEPLEQARIVAQEARKIDNLPQYIDQYFARLLGEIDRAIGGSQWEPVGRLRVSVDNVRKSLPADALEEEKERLAHGQQESLSL